MNVSIQAPSDKRTSIIQKREDTAGWKTDYFNTYLLWQEYDSAVNEEKTEKLDYTSAQQKLSELTFQFKLKQQQQNMPQSPLKKFLQKIWR